MGLAEAYPLEVPKYFKGRQRYEAVCLYLTHNFVMWMSGGALSIPNAAVTNPIPSGYEVWTIQGPFP